MRANDNRETPPAVPGRRKRAKASFPPLTGRFASLDFETADYGRDSACAVSLVLVEKEKIVDKWTRLIRPPRRDFCFTYLHGIAWSHVKDQPSFAELWPEMAPLLAGAEFVAAHNASFDRSVLRACCKSAGIEFAPGPFLCTVKLARAVWALYPTKLSDVCQHLKIPLKHHDAASDAHACANIVLAAREQGHDYGTLLTRHGLKR